MVRLGRIEIKLYERDDDGLKVGILRIHGDEDEERP